MKNNWPLSLIPLILLLVVQGLMAAYGGFSLMLRPDGTLLQMPLSWLDASPFNNYLIPGMILGVVLGVLPFLIVYGLLFRPEWRLPDWLNVYPERHWALTFSMYLGVMIVCWIAFQQLLVQQYFWLQPVITFLGVGIIISSLLPATIRFYEKADRERML